jgi:hypothetical protein
MSDCLSYDFFSIAPLHVCRCQVCARLPPSLILRSPPPYKSGFSNILLSCFCANSACLSGYSNEFLIWQMSLECINGVPSLIQRVPLSAPFLAKLSGSHPSCPPIGIGMEKVLLGYFRIMLYLQSRLQVVGVLNGYCYHRLGFSTPK